MTDDEAKARAEALYHDSSFPARACDYCGRSYTGPAVYCSLDCALADSGADEPETDLCR